MSIIVINRGRYNEIINERKNKNVKFALKLSEFAFYKLHYYMK